MLNITRITNIFTGERREWKAHAGMPLASYFPRSFDPERGVVELNGQRMDDFDVVPSEGSYVMFAHLPGAEPATWITILIILQVATIATSILLRPKAPSISGPGKELEADRNFLGPSTRVGPNVRVPVIMGTMRAGGHIIESFTDTHLSHDGGVEVNDPLFSKAIISGVQVHSKKILKQAVDGREVLNTRVAFSWGPVESITAPEIDGNPLDNFGDLTLQFKPGNDSDKTLFGFSEQKDQNQPNLPRTVGKTDDPNGVVRSTQKVVIGVEIAIQFAEGLYKLNKRGKIRNQLARLIVEYKKTTDANWTLFLPPQPAPLGFPVGTIELSGRTRSPHTRWIRLPPLDPDFYDIRVTRTSDDTTASTRKVDEFQWQFLQEIVTGARAHPGLAELGFRQIPQEQTRAPRNFSAVVKGLNDVRVYSSLTAYTVTFTDNPAWLFMRVMADALWGYGKFFTYAKSFKIQDFIDLAAHCDVLVDDGTGTSTTEKRCTMGIEMRDSFSLSQVIELFNLAADCRFYMDGDKWRVDINNDKTSELVITEGSYLKDTLQWRFPDLRERSTRFVGRFQNENNRYIEDEISVVDQEAVEKTRHLTSEIKLGGVTRTSQVLRALQKFVNFNRISDELIEFKAGLTTLDLRIGSVFQLESETSGLIVSSGRVLEITAAADRLRLDTELSLNTAKVYNLAVHHVDRTIDILPLLNVPADKTDWIEVNPVGFGSDLRVGDEYYLAESTVSKNLFRVEQISLEEDLNRTILASKYSTDLNVVDIVSEIQNNQTIFDEDKIPPAVTNLTVAEPIDEDDNVTGQGLNVSWETPTGGSVGSEVWFREDSDVNWIYLGTTEQYSTEIPVDELEEGVKYHVTVRAVSPRGAKLTLDDTPSVAFTTTGVAAGGTL